MTERKGFLALFGLAPLSELNTLERQLELANDDNLRLRSRNSAMADQLNAANSDLKASLEKRDQYATDNAKLIEEVKKLKGDYAYTVDSFDARIDDTNPRLLNFGRAFVDLEAAIRRYFSAGKVSPKERLALKDKVLDLLTQANMKKVTRVTAFTDLADSIKPKRPDVAAAKPEDTVEIHYRTK